MVGLRGMAKRMCPLNLTLPAKKTNSGQQLTIENINDLYIRKEESFTENDVREIDLGQNVR